MPDDLPKKTAGDVVHAAKEAVFSLVPGGSQLFNLVLSSPLSKRRDAWLNALAERVAKLEQEGRVKIEDLRNNDEFISTIMQASQVAIRNHQQVKLDALRNAVINAAVGRSPDDAKREMFLGIVDTFTIWHLRVFVFLADPTQGIDAKQLNQDLTTGSFNDVIDVLQGAFSDLADQREFILKILDDLGRGGLILSGL